MKDGRYEIGEKVICRIRGEEFEDGIPQFFLGHIVPPRFGYEVSDGGYFVQMSEYSNTWREVSFYDITSYNKFKFSDLSWESQTAQRAIRHLKELWSWGEKQDEVKASKS